MENNNVNKPLNLNLTINDFINKHTDPQVYFLSEARVTSNTFLWYIASDYFHHPIIRYYLKDIYS